MIPCARLIGPVIGLLATFTVCGCSTAGRLTGKAIGGVGSLAEKTTVVAIKTTGRVTTSTARAAVTTSGQVVQSVTTAGFVTFKDTATGVSRQVPYQEGLRLYAASQSAKLGAGLKAFQLVRNGVPLPAAKWSSVMPGTAQDSLLKRGDVIRIQRAGHVSPGRSKRV